MFYIPFERRIYRCKNEVIEIERQKGKESENNLIKNVLHTKFPISRREFSQAKGRPEYTGRVEQLTEALSQVAQQQGYTCPDASSKPASVKWWRLIYISEAEALVLPVSWPCSTMTKYTQSFLRVWTGRKVKLHEELKLTLPESHCCAWSPSVWLE